MTVGRPIMRYHGGKWRLAPWIISHLPPHRIYVEPFGGAASVLLQKPRSYAEVFNDRWDTVVNVFRVLRDPAKAARLRELLELTPFARSEFVGADPTTGDEVEDARRTIFRSFAGFGSGSVNVGHLTGFRANSHRNGTVAAVDWRRFPRHIEAFTDRLQGVVIENTDAGRVMAQHDREDTLFYLDPPYVHSTRGHRRGRGVYAYEMTDDDHRKLAAEVRRLRGMVVISGYHSPLYDELYGDWRRVERVTRSERAKERTEVMWFSPNAEARQATLIA